MKLVMCLTLETTCEKSLESGFNWYASQPSFQIICAAYAIRPADVCYYEPDAARYIDLSAPDARLPDHVSELLADPDVTKVVHTNFALRCLEHAGYTIAGEVKDIFSWADDHSFPWALTGIADELGSAAHNYDDNLRHRLLRTFSFCVGTEKFVRIKAARGYDWWRMLTMCREKVRTLAVTELCCGAFAEDHSFSEYGMDYSSIMSDHTLWA